MTHLGLTSRASRQKCHTLSHQLHCFLLNSLLLNVMENKLSLRNTTSFNKTAVFDTLGIKINVSQRFLY